MKFSVIIATYKPCLEDIIFTLNSVEKQQMKEIEVIITDDGSPDNKFDDIDKYCKDNQFNNVRLIPHDKNCGTVSNFLSAVSECKGEYVKPISPGDGLFDEHTLDEVYHFMSENDIDGCFGLLNAYRNVNGTIESFDYFHPLDLDAYRSSKKNRVLKNLVLYSDHVCGAAVFFKTSRFKYLLEAIKDDVVFVEDLMQVICAAEDKPLALFDKYAVWYQLGTGVSTQYNSPVRKRMKLDSTLFYQNIMGAYDDNKFVKKRRRHLKAYAEPNYYVQVLKIMALNPSVFVFLSRFFLQKRERIQYRKNCHIGFLNDQVFVNNCFGTEGTCK